MSDETIRKILENMARKVVLSDLQKHRMFGEKYTRKQKEEYVKKNQFMIKLCVDDMIKKYTNRGELHLLYDADEDEECEKRIRKYLCGGDNCANDF